MNKVKDLIKCIIEGKDYTEAFNTIMLEKVKIRLEEEKIGLASTLFSEGMDDCCGCEQSKSDGSGKCVACRMPIKMAKDPKGTPKEVWKVDSTKTNNVMKESDQLEERELTSGEIKSKEDIVMALKTKKDKKGQTQLDKLEKLYGKEEARSRMYAIATAAAKKSK